MSEASLERVIEQMRGIIERLIDLLEKVMEENDKPRIDACVSGFEATGGEEEY